MMRGGLRTSRSRSVREGFSLIEALVALAIASMTLMAIFELQIQMARGQERAIRAIEQVAAQENGIALIRDINFRAEPEGHISLPGGDLIAWTSEPVGSPRRNTSYPTGYGDYEMQLYRVTLSIERKSGPSSAPMQFERLGWSYLSGGSS